MAVGLIPQEIRATPAAIRATLEHTRPAAHAAAAAIRDRAPRRVFITGNGTSFYSSLAASYTGRALAGPDDPFVLAAMSGDLRYYTPALDAHDMIVGVWASGEFRDVIALFERLRPQPGAGHDEDLCQYLDRHSPPFARVVPGTRIDFCRPRRLRRARSGR